MGHKREPVSLQPHPKSLFVQRRPEHIGAPLLPGLEEQEPIELHHFIVSVTLVIGTRVLEFDVVPLGLLLLIEVGSGGL